MSVHIESPLGFTADFPEHTQVLEDSTAGPNTEQYGLLGDVLVTVIKDDTSVQGAPQANGWAHLMEFAGTGWQFLWGAGPNGKIGLWNMNPSSRIRFTDQPSGLSA